jgi:hypothetical protein
MFNSRGVVYVVSYTGSSEAPAETATADRFLNSFKLIGGCEDLITVPSGSNPFLWFSGLLNTETGWHRVDSPYGIGFLFPAPGHLQWTDEPGPAGVIRHYTYSFSSDEYLFSAEILDGYKPALRTSRAQLQTELGSYLARTKRDLESGGYKIGECKPISTGDRAGYDCALTLPGGELSGHGQVYVTPTRNFFITAFRYARVTDEKPIARFLESLRID